MFDQNSPRERLVLAALHLAEANGWRDLTLLQIAAAASMPLPDMRHHFTSKAAILVAFAEAVDRDMLHKFASPGIDVPRDRLFDVILSRFESMQPHKNALRRIVEDASPSFDMLKVALKSQYWTLVAAGVNPEGSLGAIRMQGLLSLYADVFRIWLADDDVGMARTMATLDRRLRRAESAMARIERVSEGLRHLGGMMRRRRNSPAVDSSTQSI